MRCDQCAGLNDFARDLVTQMVDVREKVTKTYPNGDVEEFERLVKLNEVSRKDSGKKYSGMFGDEYTLNRYTLPTGEVYEEYVQAEPWSSGPVFFLALKDGDGNVVEESLWDDEDIYNA